MIFTFEHSSALYYYLAMVPTFCDFYREPLREVTVKTYAGAVLLIIAPVMCTCGLELLGAMMLAGSGYLFNLEKPIVPRRRRIRNAECKG